MKKNYIDVPLGGNSFITNKPQSAEDHITPDGWRRWSNPKYEYHVYFKPAVDAEISLKLMIHKAKTASVIKASIPGGRTFVGIINPGDKEVDLGSYKVNAGYVDVKIQGVTREGGTFASPTNLRVYGLRDEEMASYARKSDKKDFYWIRRGPSVHCQYDTAVAGDDVEWFYNEVSVKPGQDPHGMYCMAIGFHGGYYGMQVCDNGVRKLIFSIWSPFNTDNPDEIPPEKMVKVLKKHPKVWTGEFGHEGSGGQSFMNYDWESGKTYKFLCHIVPAENNYTEFTSYFFFPETGRWELLCSFLRPETQTYFKGVYSFLESFIDVNGHNFRKVSFGNQWARTKAGKWVPIDTMKLTGDTTARKAQRQDYGGGVEDGKFFLNNCGFFSEQVPLDTKFTVDASDHPLPEVDFAALEKTR